MVCQSHVLLHLVKNTLHYESSKHSQNQIHFPVVRLFVFLILLQSSL